MRPSRGSACWVHVSAARPATAGSSSRAPECVSVARACSGRTARNPCFSGSGVSASDASPRPCLGLWEADWALWLTWTPADRLRSASRRWIACRGGCVAAGDGGAHRGSAGPLATQGMRTPCHLWDMGLGSGCWAYLACPSDPEDPGSAGQARLGGRSHRNRPGKVADCGRGAQMGVPAALWLRWGPPSRLRVSGQKPEGTFAEDNPRCWVSRTGCFRRCFCGR